LKLTEVKNNEEVIITKILGHGSFRKRITEMGFVKGKKVKVIKSAPFNGAIEYKILNYNISLRRSEAELIEVASPEDYISPPVSNNDPPYPHGPHHTHGHPLETGKAKRKHLHTFNHKNTDGNFDYGLNHGRRSGKAILANHWHFRREWFRHKMHFRKPWEKAESNNRQNQHNGIFSHDSLINHGAVTGDTINVALVGNPNSGKTTLYNTISGAKEKVGNYSGVTVEIKKTTFAYRGFNFNFFDLPGTYSLTAYSTEEIYVRKFIYEETPDVVINVVDASNLERNLFLTTQLIDMDIRVVVALNMFDEIKKQNLELDYPAIAKLLGIPFIPTVSSKGTGIIELLDKVIDVYEGTDKTIRHIHINYGAELESSIAKIREKIKINKPITDKISSRFLAIKILEKDKHALELLSGYENFADIKETSEKEVKRIELLENDDSESIITDAKFSFISGALKETFRHPQNQPKSQSEKIDQVLTHPFWGFPIFILMLFIVFFATFKIGAIPMRWIDNGVNGLGNMVARFMGDGMLKDLLVDGIISGTGSVLVFLPNILILFFFISLLEGSGYMARAAFIMDKIMHRFGLHGRSFIPLVIGFGCNVPAIMATRTLRNKGDRILTMLIIPFMSCSARLPVYILIISAFFKKYQAFYLIGIYVLGIVIAFITAQILNTTLFRNKETPFVMELPDYRLPTIRNIFYHMWDKTYQYIKKIGTVILIGVVIIWALEYFPRTTKNTESYAAQANQVSNDSSLNGEAKKEQLENIHSSIDADRLSNSYLGRIGKVIEPVMKPLGFDWKMSISLLAGLPAKEIIISTMGVLYQPGSNYSLHLKNNLGEPGRKPAGAIGPTPFSTTSALAFLVFVLIYFPCIGVVATIKNESGHWGWALFTVLYTTALAWLAAFAVFQAGSLIV
jgi:ferrous iron transport protein B